MSNHLLIKLIKLIKLVGGGGWNVGLMVVCVGEWGCRVMFVFVGVGL